MSTLRIIPLTRRESAWACLPKVEVHPTLHIEGDLVTIYDTARHGRVIDAKEDFQIEDHALRAGAYQIIDPTPTKA